MRYSNPPKPSRNAYPGVAAAYVPLIPWLVQEARKCGYTLAIHGSMCSDLDIVAVPWVLQADDAETLVEALRKIVGGVVPNMPTTDPDDERLTNPVMRPHGRRCWSIYLNPDCSWGDGPYIDLSVMPREGDAVMSVCKLCETRPRLDGGEHCERCQKSFDVSERILATKHDE